MASEAGWRADVRVFREELRGAERYHRELHRAWKKAVRRAATEHRKAVRAQERAERCKSPKACARAREAAGFYESAAETQRGHVARLSGLIARQNEIEADLKRWIANARRKK